MSDVSKHNLDLSAGPAVQIATPYSTGTGFWWKDAGLYVTCEHIVRDNREVVIQHSDAERCLAKVLFTDMLNDVAFLRTDEKEIRENGHLTTATLTAGLPLTALGFTPNTHLKRENLRLLSPDFRYEGRDYLLLDTETDSDFTGGPLLNAAGEICGINIGFLAEEDYQLALSAEQIRQIHSDYLSGGGAVGTRCINCGRLAFAGQGNGKICLGCLDYLVLPDQAKEYRPHGIGYTIERLIQKTGHDPRLSRRGPNNWQILQGSARVNISYYEKNGLITGDAHLCLLPPDDTKILQFLLRENHKSEGLTFSVDKRDIILSLLIHDRYLNVESGVRLFRHLFEQADYYDNILVEEFGAEWH